MKHYLWLIVVLANMASADRSRAATEDGPQSAAAPEVVTKISEHRLTIADVPPPKQFVTQHKTTIRGKAISYTATAGETIITNFAGEPIARFFAFAYVRNPPDPARPVIFIFNGGPGSSSIWLHLGALGPKRLVLDHEVNPSNTPPFGLRDNPFSPLDVADLVFVDPVGTGFSHATGNAKDTDFFGVDADADSVARFIEEWLSANGRWNSRKYLVGESYGSIRAAILPRALMGGPTYTGVMRGITTDGVVILGVALNVELQAAPDAPDPNGPDWGAIVHMPSLAVTAWYHGKIDRKGRTAGQIYDEAKHFAATEYADALARLGAETLTDAEKTTVAQRLAEYTALSSDAWLRSDLRISSQSFAKQLLTKEGMEVGLYDSRYTLPLKGSGGDPVADDPAMGRYVPGFIVAFHDMLTQELKVHMPFPYGAIVWEGLNDRWNWKRSGVPLGQSYAVDLATAMRRNPKLKVLSASGYYDMLTTPYSAERQLLKAGVPTDRLTVRAYESGHMLYLGDTAEAFANDVRALVTGTLSPSVAVH